MTDLDKPFTQKSLAAVLEVSQPKISDYVSRGIVRNGMTLQAAIAAVFAHLREVAAGRLAAGDLDLASERAALAKAQREKLEMQNAQTRRELAPLYVIEQVLGRAGAKIAGILEAIPGAIRRRNTALSADDLALVADEVAKARNTIAGVSLSDLDDDEEAAA